MIRFCNNGEVEPRSGTGQLRFAQAFMIAGLGSNRNHERQDGLIDRSALERLTSSVREADSWPLVGPHAQRKTIYALPHRLIPNLPVE